MKYLLFLIPLCLWTSCTNTSSSKEEFFVVDSLEEALLLRIEDSVQYETETLDDEMESEELLFEEKEIIRTQTYRKVSELIDWQNLEAGLNYAVVDATIKTNIADSKIDLLRIDPKLFEFSIETVQEHKKGFLTAPKWAEQEKLIAVFNAGMFQMDAQGTNAGFMKVNGKRYNTHHNHDKTYFAFNPSDSVFPKAKIIDKSCDIWEQEIEKYQSVTQSIRMYSCNNKNVWGQQKKYWSMVVMGETVGGEIFFAFTRSPYSVHDFVTMLTSYDLKVSNLMYLEGGPEASFYLNHENKVVKKMGSYETGFNENDGNHDFWGLPNVIGVRRKT